MTPELTINGTDALREWGVRLIGESLQNLMKPLDIKDRVSSTSRLEDGDRYIIAQGIPRIKAREVQVEFSVEGRTREEFIDRFDKFCNMLHEGVVTLSTRYQQNVRYRLLFTSCTSFYTRRTLCKMAVKFIEPNPKNRN